MGQWCKWTQIGPVPVAVFWWPGNSCPLGSSPTGVPIASGVGNAVSGAEQAAGTVQTAASGVASWATGLGDLLGWVNPTTAEGQAHWKAIGLVMVAGVLIVAGVVFMVSSSGTGRVATQTGERLA